MTGRRNRRAIVLLSGVLFASGSDHSVAQEVAIPAARVASASRPEWGTQSLIFTHIGFNDFSPTRYETTYQVLHESDLTWALFATPTAGEFGAMAHVPSGALLAYLELDYCDSSPTYDVKIALYQCSYDGTSCSAVASLSSGDGSMGCHSMSTDLTAKGVTMDNNANELVVKAQTDAGDETTRLSGVYVGYRLQISPAPATATFADVPAIHPYYRAIEALAKSGITGGCGGGNFCPNSNVTRGEMAAFLARALGLHFPY